MKVICVRAFSHHKPGDPAEMPDGAQYSDLYFAAEGSPEAKAAIAQASARKKAAAAADSGPDKAGPDTASSQASAARPADTSTDTPKAGS